MGWLASLTLEDEVEIVIGSTSGRFASMRMFFSDELSGYLRTGMWT